MALFSRGAVYFVHLIFKDWRKKNGGQSSIIWPKCFLPRPILQNPTWQTITRAVFLRQFPNDLLLNESDSSRLTHVVDVKLYNLISY